MEINGFDISHHNGAFDWNKMQTASLVNNLYFAYIKATDGANFIDAQFSTNWQLASEKGFLKGAYHFFLPAKDPVAQANFFINTVGHLSPGNLPPVIDVEWTEIKHADGTIGRPEQWDANNHPQNLQKIMEWMSTVENAMKIKPAIYTSSAFWNQFLAKNSSGDQQALAQYPLWLVNYSPSVPKPIALWPHHTFMQVSGGAAHPTGLFYDYLDHNVFNGKLSDLLNLTVQGLTFRKGAPKSAIVRDFQQKLNSLDANKYNTNGVDGVFGNGTFNAISAFQADNGLMANGIIDSATWSALMR